MTTPDCGTCARRECPDHGQPHNMRTMTAEECEAAKPKRDPREGDWAFAAYRERVLSGMNRAAAEDEEECEAKGESLPVAVWEGEIKIGPVRLSCYVLDDGQRIIGADGMAELFAYFASGGGVTEDEAREIARFVRATP